MALAPQCAIIVVAPEVYADRWEQVIVAGAFDLILFPFNRDEVSEVFHSAQAFAAEQLSGEARCAGLKDTPAAAKCLADGGNSQEIQEIKPLRTA